METYSYVYTGGRLTQETVTTVTTTEAGTETATDTLDYFYGVNGPASVNWNGTDYYYLTNAQGDIVALLDESGNFVVQYSYDAWGNPLSTTGSMADTLGSRNSLRYRSYVYDDETGLYYLNTRYYDPEICRFINADDVYYLGVGSSLTSYNLFTYCCNNPVMGYDPVGHWDWGWEEQAALGATVLIIGLALLFAVPSGGSSLAAGTLALESVTTMTAAGGALSITGTVIFGDAVAQATINYAKQSRKSGKERASDKPSWVSQNDVDLSKSSQENASDLLNNKYGSGNWRKGPKTEYNQIVKWIDRGLRTFALFMTDMFVED